MSERRAQHVSVGHVAEVVFYAGPSGIMETFKQWISLIRFML